MELTSTQIHFNPFKHHLGFICNLILKMSDAPVEVKTGAVKEIKSVNANLIDVYTGKFTPLEIQEMVSLDLNQRGIKNEPEFTHWLGAKEHQEVKLSDHSIWILRKSIFKAAFVHIHPSRDPSLTFRIHGNAWKTVVGLLIMYPDFIQGLPSFEDINDFRKEFMDLSPVKGSENLQRVLKVYGFIKQCLDSPVDGIHF